MDYTEKRNLILNGDMKKVIITLALPIMMTNLIQTVYNITDTFFVSKLGSTEVAGVQLVWSLIFMMMSFGMGIQLAGSALISQYIGQGEEESAKKVGGQIIVFLAGVAIIVALIGYSFADEIVSLLGATGSLYDNGYIFLKIMASGIPTIYAMFIYNSIKQGQGDTFTPMIVSILSVICNIILDPIFIFTMDLGVAGAAYATVISRGIFGVIAVVTLFHPRESLMIHLEHLRPNKEILKKIAVIGIPTGLGQATAAFGFTILNVIIISYGEIILTSFAIGNKITSIIMMPAMGVGSALASVVGQNLGADNVKRARHAVVTSIKLCTIILVIGAAIIIPLSESIIRVFTSDPEIISNASYYIKVILYSVPLMGIFQIWNGTFQGSGHTMLSMAITMGRLWGIRLPVLMLFVKFSSFGPEIVWYVMVGSNAIICIIGYFIFRSGLWEEKIVKKSLT